ncbi:hypothetical protein Tco_0320650 [Tanacetum coccineum]
MCACCESVENTLKSWPLVMLGAQGLKSKPLIELWDYGLPAWHTHVGVGFSYSDGFGWMWGVNEVERDRFRRLWVLVFNESFGHWQKQSPKVIIDIAPMVLLSYGFGDLAELALVVNTLGSWHF